jgi:PAS domain S-box-containing protein
MKLKARIMIALGVMTLLIFMLALGATFFMKRLGNASENIMKDNFSSIADANAMIDALDLMDNAVSHSMFDSSGRAGKYSEIFLRNDSSFIHNLVLAEGNITEPGEGEIVKQIRKRYTEYTTHATASLISRKPMLDEMAPQYDSVKASCIALLNVNTRGMNIRNTRAEEVSKDAVLYTVLMAGIALILAFALLFRFPSVVINPIAELTAKIKSISDRKYSERIEVRSNDEVGELALNFNKMASKLDEYERSNIDALIAEKKRSEAIVQSMNDGVIVLGNDLRIILVNSVGSQLLGLSEGELIGKDVRDVAKSNNLVETLIKDILMPTSKKNGEESYLRIYHETKEEFFLKDVIRVELNEGDPSTALGYIIELKNVSEFKALDEAKSGFVTTVSHELRTPLSALNMSLRLLQDERIGPLNDEQARILDAMKQEIRRLLRIVSELLELSRAEVGAELMHMLLVAPENIVDAAITPTMLQADQKHVNLNIDLPDNLPAVRADESKVAWVLINLLTNAIRFTPSEGNVTLRIARKDSTVEFSVTDTGVGIEPQNLSRIFEKFFQASTKQAEHHTGVGLGLAISKEIIEAHGGKIWAESEFGKGSSFRFYLNI